MIQVVLITQSTRKRAIELHDFLLRRFFENEDSSPRHVVSMTLATFDSQDFSALMAETVKKETDEALAFEWKREDRRRKIRRECL